MPTKQNKDVVCLLDKFSKRDVRLWRQRYEAIAEYYWDHYSYFAHQRSFVMEELKEALAINCSAYAFSNWQRVASYQFANHPLSAKGSILSDPGGRFNIGDIDTAKFPKFAALYIAEDRTTAYREKFGLDQNATITGLTAEELTLTSNESIAIITVNGKIKQAFDLTKQTILNDFFHTIKKIKLPKHLVKRANQLNIYPMFHVPTAKTLKETLLMPNCRDIPMLFDVPANPQIFGHIAYCRC